MKKIVICMMLAVLCLAGSAGSFLLLDAPRYGGMAYRQISRMADGFDRDDRKNGPDRRMPRGHHDRDNDRRPAAPADRPVPPPRAPGNAPAPAPAPAPAQPAPGAAPAAPAPAPAPAPEAPAAP